MATQNRGLCEALLLNKSVYISSINIHKELGLLFEIPQENFFYPLENIEISLSNNNYQKNYLSLFSEKTFYLNFMTVVNYLESPQ